MSINSYIEALSALKKGRPNQASRKVGNNTYLEMDAISECIHLRLHRTRILTWWADGHITVQGQNWQTNLTRDRLNTFLPDPFYIATRKVVTWSLAGRADHREWLVRMVNSDEFVAHHDCMDLSMWGDLVAEQVANDAKRAAFSAKWRPLILAERRRVRNDLKAKAEIAEAAADARFIAEEAAAAAARKEYSNA